MNTLVKMRLRLIAVVGAAAALASAWMAFPAEAQAADNGGMSEAFHRCTLYIFDYENASHKGRNATTEAEREEADREREQALEDYAREGCDDVIGSPLEIRSSGIGWTTTVDTKGLPQLQLTTRFGRYKVVRVSSDSLQWTLQSR